MSDDDKYLKGTINTGIRSYFYLMSGLNILNEFRNLFLGIFALYIALKLDNVLYGVGIFAGCVIILIFVGRYNVHRLSKVNEWLSMRFSTHYSIKSFNYVQDSNQVLKDIKQLLEDIKSSKIQI